MYGTQRKMIYVLVSVGINTYLFISSVGADAIIFAFCHQRCLTAFVPMPLMEMPFFDVGGVIINVDRRLMEMTLSLMLIESGINADRRQHDKSNVANLHPYSMVSISKSFIPFILLPDSICINFVDGDITMHILFNIS